MISRIGRGIVGVSSDGTVFTERMIPLKRAMKAALREAGQFRRAVPVGRIRALQFVENPIYPLGCSPNYGGYVYETCRHCVAEAADVCKVRSEVNMSDGSRAHVVYTAPLKACSSWTCWFFARFVNRFGWILDKCVETHDSALISRGNEGRRPHLVLFAGSEDGSLALFTPSAESSGFFVTPFKVRIQSTDYHAEGGPRVIEWETNIDGTGLFLVWFGEKYVLPFWAYYSYPSSVPVKPGFSGSNAYIIRE